MGMGDSSAISARSLKQAKAKALNGRREARKVRLMTKSKRGPWTISAVRTAYDNPWISVDHHDVVRPDGKPGVYGTVRFKNLAIAILPLDDDGNTWLVGQHRFPLDQYSWEIPEGGGAKGVAPLQSARRELKEETGIVAREWTEVLRMHLSNSVTDEESISFLARGLSFEAAAPEGDEELTVKKVSFEEVYRMVLRGEITDALAVATILRVKCMLAGV
jgi:8-oxo-dGTP pyrophosphatase MutT (NUDIX family)